MISREDMKKFAPKALPEYVEALINGLEYLEEAGITESELRTAHFMAQCAAETGGFTVIRESLTYTTAARLRKVWPARFRNKSDAELAHLLRNPVALGDAVYRGRMGNTASGDGYNYRGGGFLQTTGKSAVEKYCQACGVSIRPDILDDIPMTLRFACVEWVESGCNEWADENALVKVSRAINVGSATSNVAPVGMKEREQWFAKAWAIWGDKGKPDTIATSKMTPGAKAAVAGAAGTGGTAIVSNPPPVVADTVSNIGAWQGIGKAVAALGAVFVEHPLLMSGVGAVAIGVLFWPQISSMFGREA
jgi:putative chitinase